MLTDDRLDQTLRCLDPASPGLDAAQAARKDALLRSLVGAGATRAVDEPQAAQVDAPGRQRHRRVTRWAAPLLAAAAVGGIVVALPALGGSGSSGGVAYGSWTATPSPYTGPALDATTTACLQHLREIAADHADITADPATARVVLAERRGSLGLVQVVTRDGSVLQCYADTARPDVLAGTTGGLATKDSAPPRPMRPGTIEANSGARSVDEHGAYALTSGRVGPDVVGVTVRSGERTTVATVEDGYFGAWWPTPTAGKPNEQNPAEHYDLTLADGRRIIDAPNTLFGTPDRDPGPRAISAISLGGGAHEGGGTTATVSGRAGVDVRSVTVHTESGPVVAQVEEGGTFTAEWPDADAEAPMPTFDVTLTDGTVLTSVTPGR